MTIKEFIEKAIEGGWKKPDTLYSEPTFESPAIPMTWIDSLGYFKSTADMFLDPLAWKAVGKVMDAEQRFWIGTKENMHDMIDTLIEGKTIEEFLKGL